MTSPEDKPQKRRSKTRRGRYKRQQTQEKRRAAEEKSATPADRLGVWGSMQKDDARLVGRAVGEAWPVKPENREKVVEVMGTMVECAESDFAKIAAAGVMVRMDQVNLAREKMEQEDRHHAEGEKHLHLHGSIDAINAAVQELRRDRLIDAYRQSMTEASHPSSVDPSTDTDLE